MKTKMEQKIISLDKVDFDSIDEKEINKRNVSKHMQVFETYRQEWKSHNKAVKSGRKATRPVFPFPAIRARGVAGWYFPLAPDGWAIMLAAKKAGITRVLVDVEEPVDDDTPIHPNDFFACFKAALRSLHATDLQRIGFFKPLILAMLHEGFTNNECRDIFLDWLDATTPEYR